jgi:glycosyltransferase involved in cell wall biosynthesis
VTTDTRSPRVSGLVREARRRLGRARVEWGGRRLVRRHVDLPSLHGGGVWAITLVRDERDTIGGVLDHLLAEGIQRILVVDHLSRDGTSEILAEYAGRCPVTVVRLNLEGFRQGDVMTVLARYAARRGARWIIPFDADELWFSRGRRTLAEHLLGCDDAVVRAAMWDYLPTEEDDPSQSNPFERMAYRRRAAPGSPAWSKVAFRAYRRAVLSVGNHAVRRPGPVGNGLAIAHYQFRSREQFIRKVTQGNAALEAAGLSERAGRHWRDLAAHRDELDRLWTGLCRDQTLPFDWWPVPGVLIHDPGCRLLRDGLSDA